MGSIIEHNDTLQLTTEQGFPAELDLAKHRAKSFTVEDFVGRVFEFKKSDLRLYNLEPTRCFLVQNIDGKWLHWGHCLIIEQTINPEKNLTSGKFVISKIYEPEYQVEVTKNESPAKKSYF